ncbi:ATP-dependent nuclease [Candidatus Nanohalococcus occultus]|uniref:ATP-dependent nuclease n=1 Tax=Candidatus Nanohalococcus occultus TaxID=2978047 RepID=UPI0039E086CA
MPLDIVSFRVKNYKSIKDSGLLNITDFTTLIGKNDAGKSSFLEALTLFLKKSKPNDGHFHKKNEDEIVFQAKLRDIPEELQEVLDEDYHTEEEELFEIKRIFQRRSNTTPKDDTFVNGKKLSKGAITTDEERLTKAKSRDYIWDHLPAVIFVPAERDVGEETKLKGGTFMNDILVPILEDGGIEGSQEIEKARRTLEESLNQTSSTLGDKLAKNMEEHMADLKGVSVRTGDVSIRKAINPEIKLQDKYLPDSVDIRERGSGIGSLFILSLMQTYVDLQLGEGYYLLFEEPGNWLHPGAERKMMGTLKDISEEGGKIMISTHSQIFIDQKDKDGMYLVKRENGESNYKSIQEKAFKAIEEIGAKNSDLLQSDFVIYVEGPSDVQILKEVSNHVEGWESKNITIQHLGGTGNLHHCEPEKLRSINRNLAFLLDSDKQKEQDSPGKIASNLQRSCKNLGIKCKILEKRMIENYFTADAIKEVFGFEDIQEDFVTDYENIPKKIEDKIGAERIPDPEIQKGDFQKTSHGLRIVKQMYKNGSEIEEIEEFLESCLREC